MMQAERVKYERMHRVPGYSLGPGESYVRQLAPYLAPGNTVIDFGCGSGDAGRMLADMGYRVFLVDITEAGLNPRHGLPFLRASLHELPGDLPQADWGFCCDVMEHLPEEWVGPALKGMRDHVPNVFFSISGVADGWGHHIGEPLHLTVKPWAWWMDEIRQYWRTVTRLNVSDTVFEFMGRA